METSFTKMPSATWQEGLTYAGGWEMQPSGGQRVRNRGSKGLELETAKATGPETYAALVTSVPGFSQWRTLTVELSTVEQFRERPNVWEVAWVLFDFVHVNLFYSAILKTDGWEIAKEWQDETGAQRQDFLAEGPGVFPIGHRYEMQITQTVATDGSLVLGLGYADLTTGLEMTPLGTAIDGGGRESGPTYPDGKVGLYAEDCRCRFYRVTIE